MAKTEVRGGQIKDTSIGRSDLDVSTTGEAVVRRIIAGTNVTLGSTGTDTGTGDVTINASLSGGSGDMVLASAQTVTGAKTFNANTLLDKGSEVFNVKSYGATGDGSTDDSTAIQAAITAAEVSGGVVFIPIGTYIINATLTIAANNVSLLGAGWGSILKIKNGTNIYAITVDDAALRKNLNFRNFKIDGNRLNNLTSGGGITGALASALVENVWITACRDKCINLKGVAGNATYGYNNRIVSNLLDNASPTGIYIQYSDENQITGNVFSDFSTYGIYDTGGYNIFHHNTFVGGATATTGVGIYITGTNGSIVDGNVFDGTHEEAIRADASYTNIVNNRISKVAGGTTTVPAIKVLNGAHNVVANNTVIGGSFYTYAFEESSSTYTHLGQNYFEAGTSGTTLLTSTTEGIFFDGNNVGINTKTPNEKLDLVGNFQIKDAETATKAYRFRTSGADLDFDFAGDGMYLSGYSNPDFTGTQKFYLGMNGGNTDAFGNWYFHTVPFAATAVTIEPGAAAPLQITGNLTVSGDLTVADEAYNAINWDASLEVPTKNAVRDKIVAIDNDVGNLDGSITLHGLATSAHGANGAVVGTTNSQTLTNKTLTSPVINGATGTGMAASGAITSNGTAGIGYATGAGGTVTQATSKSTGVTLSKLCGTITLNGAALANQTTVSFTLTNSTITANDMVLINHNSVGTLGAYNFAVTPAAGSASIAVRNIHTASLSEAIVLRFVVIKAVTS